MKTALALIAAFALTACVSEPGAAPCCTRLSVGTSVRQRTMTLLGVAVCR